MLPLMASFGAVDTIIDGINYILTDENMTATVHTPKDGLVYSGDMVIPQTVTTGGKTYTVTSIGYGAFSNCSGLTAITIPDTVKTIGDRAFYSTGIKNLTIGEGVTSIGASAFPYNIENVVCLAKEEPAANKRSFSNQQNTYLYVLPESLEAYKATAPWSEFKAIRPMEDYTAVKTVNATITTTAVYSLDGKRTDSMRKGQNIIRTTDGKTRKMVIR